MNRLKILYDKVSHIIPPPRILQKRYLVIITAVIYIIAKLYVTHTPSNEDDKILENIRISVAQMLAQNEDSSHEEENSV